MRRKKWRRIRSTSATGRANGACTLRVPGAAVNAHGLRKERRFSSSCGFAESKSVTLKRKVKSITLKRKVKCPNLQDQLHGQRLDRSYVVLTCCHTLASRESSAIQPRRKERSSTQCAAAGPSPAINGVPDHYNALLKQRYK